MKSIYNFGWLMILSRHNASDCCFIMYLHVLNLSRQLVNHRFNCMCVKCCVGLHTVHTTRYTPILYLLLVVSNYYCYLLYGCRTRFICILYLLGFYLLIRVRYSTIKIINVLYSLFIMVRGCYYSD